MSPLPTPMSDAEVRAYRESGYAVVRGVFSAAEIDELRRGCDALEASAREYVGDTFVGVTFFNMHRDVNPFAKDVTAAPVVHGQIRRVTYPYALSEVFDRYRRHERLLAVAAAILGPDLKQIVNQVNFNPPGSGAGWGWHQDYRFRKAGVKSLVRDFVQTITALDPCNTETGGIRLVPKSHELGDLKLDLEQDKAETYFDARRAVTPDLAPGDVVLFNSHVVHGSSANKSKNKRRVYINGYARGDAAVGMPVLRDGRPVAANEGKMEYEGDQETLPKASKY